MSRVKAVICAAGEGKRMRPYTAEFPKPLLQVGEKTIIEYMLDNISSSGIRDVVIVVGYKGERVQEKIGSRYKNCSITYVRNDEYEVTNNIYSLWLARDLITEGMVFFNGDIIFDREILDGFLGNDSPNSFIADPNIHLEDDAMKVVLQGGRMRKIGKHLKDDANAWAIGIYKLSQEASREYFQEAEKMFDAGNKNISFVAPLQSIAGKFPLHKYKVLPHLGWVEIDTPEDYEKAKGRIDSIVFSEKDNFKDVIFSNFRELVTSPLRRKVLNLALRGIHSVLPHRFMAEYVKVSGGKLLIKNKGFDIKNRRIFVVGAGKASAAMALELERVLGTEKITAGVVISNDTEKPTKVVEIHQADHPVPTERSLAGSEKLLSLKEKFSISKTDLIIALISGGGSSLAVYPAPGISLVDKQKTIEALIKSGGNVHDITVVKKKISRIKGGKLAEHFYPTPIISLVLSDVVGNNLEVIASGPFTKDESTAADALRIIDRYGIRKDIPKVVLDLLENNTGMTPSSKDFSHVFQEVLASNEVALQEIKSFAEKDGIEVFVTPRIQGEAKRVAYELCSEIHNRSVKRPTLFLYGGETTVTLDYPHKKGGRNQEFILSCLQYLNTRPFLGTWCVASVGTDGIDFITESAGGIIDADSLRVVREKKIDVEISSFLERHKSGRFLSQINSNICLGRPTGTNVGDITMFYLTP